MWNIPYSAVGTDNNQPVLRAYINQGVLFTVSSVAVAAHDLNSGEVLYKTFF